MLPYLSKSREWEPSIKFSNQSSKCRKGKQMLPQSPFLQENKDKCKPVNQPLYATKYPTIGLRVWNHIKNLIQLSE